MMSHRKKKKGVSVCFALAVLGLRALQCLAATVTMKDGRTYTGQISFAKGEVVQVVVGSDVQRIALADIADLNIGRPAVGPDPKIDAYEQQEKKNLPAIALKEILPATRPTTNPSTLQNGWSEADVGKVSQAGSARIDRDSLSVSGAGWGFWGTEDTGHFLYRKVSGNFDCMVHLNTLPTEESPFHTGLVVREGLATDSKMASLIIKATDQPRITNRPLNLRDRHAAAAGPQRYAWLRMIRCSDGVSGFASVDGVKWALVGWVKIEMGSDVMIGVGAAAIANQEIVTATFDHFVLSGGMYGPSTGIELTDGSRIRGELRELNDKNAVYTAAGQVEQTIRSDLVAAVLGQPLPVPIGRVIPDDKPAAHLSSGDTLEPSGGGLSVHEGRLVVTTVLFGQQSFAFDQLICTIISTQNPSASIRISTRDGSLYYCKSVSTGDGFLVLATCVGDVKIAEKDLDELRSTPDSVFEQK